MYISKIIIKNYRSFSSSSIDFNEGMNVIIGHNNAGKSNLLKALGLIFDTNNNNRPNIDDFNKDLPIEKYLGKDTEDEDYTPPKIKISVFINESRNPIKEIDDDNNVVYDWRIKINPYYIAKLTYVFFLPQGEVWNEYQKDIKKLLEEGSDNIERDFWSLIKRKYIRKYIYRIYGGNEEHKHRVNMEQIKRFDFQLLEAIRDVENQLFTGRNTLLKQVLNYFLDYDLNDDDIEEREKRLLEFREDSMNLIDSLKNRISKTPILDYSKNIGASLGGKPGFEGEITEGDLFSALKLIIEKETGIKIPATHNGLGYNNLIYISILLAKMQMSCTEYVNEDDQKVFPMLLIEEPEAHLHPSMQFKFLKFLDEKLKQRDKVRQIFVTTHSTHITSAVNLEDIIVLNKNKDLNISYPGKVFNNDCEDDIKSKAYIKRFLDATKSDMLFARNVIFVEGIAEQLLMSCFTEYINNKIKEDISLEDNHIAVVNVNGRYFNHFLKLFNYDAHEDYRKYALSKKVVCITDVDPTKKENKKGAKFKKCYPFEINVEQDKYIYKAKSDNLLSLLESYTECDNIAVVFQKEGVGKTFEYELAFHNPSCKLLITDYTSNKEELVEMMNLYNQNATLDDILDIMKYDKLANFIKEAPETWDDDLKKRSLFAARYLMSVEKNKGEHALALDYNLRQNLLSDNPKDFKVPPYISRAIKWICDIVEEI